MVDEIEGAGPDIDTLALRGIYKGCLFEGEGVVIVFTDERHKLLLSWIKYSWRLMIDSFEQKGNMAHVLKRVPDTHNSLPATHNSLPATHNSLIFSASSYVIFLTTYLN